MVLPVNATIRKKVLKVVFISLLLDLIAFSLEVPSEHNIGNKSKSLLAYILTYLNAYKVSFARPIDSRYDVVLLGGALGSLFSLLQAIASPVIGTLSDRYGRRIALLTSMCGNIISVVLWLLAADFSTFLLSRIVGGLSEGNVQIATAIGTDVSDEKQRGSTMALVGICFSISFTLGPALGAWLSTINSVQTNPFATVAGFSLFLIVIETIYLYFYLPETLPSKVISNKLKITTDSDSALSKEASSELPPEMPIIGTNSHFLLNMIHLIFILFFSGMEFSLPFMTFDLFGYTSALNGRLLGYMGLIASIIQGGITRRIPPLRAVRIGIVSCLIALFLLARIRTVTGLYIAATLLAITTATVVTGLNALSSFEAGVNERGAKLGFHRSWGQLGRAMGPLLFTSIYWWAGREFAYTIGSMGMLGVTTLVFFTLKEPKRTSLS